MPNKTDDILSQLQKSLTITVEEYKDPNRTAEVSVESMVDILSYSFLGALAFVAWGVPAISKWREKRKKKKELDQSDVGKLKKTVVEFNKTVLNDSWLDKQSFVEGQVTVPGAEVLLVNNKLPSNILGAIEDSFKKIIGFEQVIYPDYNAFVNSIIAISKPIEDTWNSLTEKKFLALSKEERAKFETLQKDVDKKLSDLIHPMVKNSNKIPNFKTIVGNLHIESEGLESSGGKNGMGVSFKPKNKINELPALTKDQIKYAGKILKEIIDYSLSNKGDLYSKVSNKVMEIPMPQDGWPYEHVPGLNIDDVFPDIALGKLGDFGALNEQYFDPIYSLEWAYESILGQVQTILLKWIEASIKR